MGLLPPQRSAGFTLTELVLVVMVLGLLAGVAAPRFFERSTFDERIARDQLAAALRHGQKLALSSHCEVRVQTTASSFRLDQRTACTSGAFGQPVFHPATGQAGYTGAMPPGVALASSVNPLHFDALGRATDAGGAVSDATLRVGGRVVQVVGATGLVRSP